MIKPYSKTQHQEISELWTLNNWATVPVSTLPTNGVVFEKEGKILGSGFLYTTDSDVVWLEWLLCHPELRGEERKEVITSLIDSLTSLAKAQGARIVFTSSKNPSLTKRLLTQGFITTDSENTHLIHTLGDK